MDKSVKYSAINKYLNGNPDKYLSDYDLYESDYHALEESDEALKIISLINIASFSKKKLDLPGNGLIDLVFIALSMGLDSRTHSIKTAVSLIAEKSACPDGGFSYSWKPPKSVSCLTGDICYLIFQTQFPLPSASDALKWILSKQRADGGWLSCPVQGPVGQLKYVLFNRHRNCYADDKNSAVRSCYYASSACVRALQEFSKTYLNSNPPLYNIQKSKLLSAIDRGFNYLIKNTKSFPEYQCVKIKFNPGTLPSPVLRGELSNFNILSLYSGVSEKMILLSSSDIFNSLIANQNPDGTWEPEKHTFYDKIFPYEFRKKAATIKAVETISLLS